MSNTGTDKVDKNTSSKTDSKASKKKKLIIAISSTTLIVLVTVIALLLIKSDDDKPKVEGDGYYLTEDNVDEITDKIESDVQNGYFETYMNTEWTFPSGKSASKNAVFGNSENNSKPIRCYVELKATGEKIYESGVIPVGSELSQIKLNTTLKAGSYDAICNVVLMDSLGDGTFKDYSTTGFDIKIHILK